MTIYKPKKGEKKEDSRVPVPEVVTEPLVNAENEKNCKAAAALLPPPQTPALIITTRRRRSNCANICVFLTALLVLIVGIIGGIYLYKHLTHRTFAGWCAVQYYEDDPTSNEYGEQRRYRGQFEEHVEIDKEYGRYERLEVPEIDECQKAIIVHDFEKNLTAIIDQTKGNCFIKPLNRSSVKPPSDFWDLLRKLKSGYYLPDAEVVKDRYEVMEPQVQNLQPYGYYIWRECRRYNTYELRKMPPNEPIAMAKRDICAAQTLTYYEGSSGTSNINKDELVFSCNM